MDFNPCEEPIVVYPERQFERALCLLIQATVKPCDFRWAEPRLGLDIAAEMLSPAGSQPEFIEIEVKSFKNQRQGGVGFGTAKGGRQVDLLLSNANELEILDRQVRWAFADATRLPGAPRYALLNCSEARNAAMAGVMRGKQNNFSMSALKAHWTVWPVFCEDLRVFLCLT
jgi:hypothetical protein